MKIILIIIVIALLIFALPVLLMPFVGKKRILGTKEVSLLLWSNGWAGFAMGDSFAFVLSRLKHLGLINRKGMQYRIDEFKMFGPLIGIDVKTDRFDYVDRIKFHFTGKNRLSSIVFHFQKDYCNRDFFLQYVKIVNLVLGEPISKTENKYDWGRVSLNLFDDNPDKLSIYLQIGA